MTAPLTLGDLLEAMADAIPDRIAVSTIDRDWAYTEIDERSTRLANHLLGLGLSVGDHVAVHSPNRIEWVDAFYGCLKARLVPININYKYLSDELTHVYTDSGARAVIVDPEYAAAVAALDLPHLAHHIVLGADYDAALAAAATERITGRSPDDHYIVYTGGTTGAPKGVVWRQEDIIRAALNAARYGAPMESIEQLAEEAVGVESPMVLLAAGPLMHGGSQWIMGNAHVAGQTIALYTDATFDPEKILDLVERSGVVSLALLGDAMARPVAEAIIAAPNRWDLSALAAISNGAAPLSQGVREQLRIALPDRLILDTYGASESGATGTHLDSGDSPTVSFGVGADVEVIDAAGQPCPPGVDGMLARTGPLPLGYHNDPVKTAATFREIDGKRWVVPGDFARREDDGTVTVLGRGSVCINTGGEKVHPEEVEAALKRHPDVFDAAVVGTPHERWGQQVVAIVEQRAGSQLAVADLLAHCHELLANYKAPKQVFFVDEVPRTPVSKVDYPATTQRAMELLES